MFASVVMICQEGLKGGEGRGDRLNGVDSEVRRFHKEEV